LRRLPEAEDVASIVKHLLGEGGRNITGMLTVGLGKPRLTCAVAAHREKVPIRVGHLTGKNLGEADQHAH
jgi:hypothetical protein